MRSNVLLFLHVLAALALLGGVLAAAVLALAARRTGAESLRLVAWQTALLVVLPAAVATIALGEGLQAKEDLGGAWLDASYPLAYLGLLLAGIVLAVLGRLALRRPRLAGATGALAAVMAVVALAVAFLMAAKPG